jgi:hypothetical protein
LLPAAGQPLLWLLRIIILFLLAWHCHRPGTCKTVTQRDTGPGQAGIGGKKVDHVNLAQGFTEKKTDSVLILGISDRDGFAENPQFSAVIKITAMTGFEQVTVVFVSAYDFTPP